MAKKQTKPVEQEQAPALEDAVEEIPDLPDPSAAPSRVQRVLGKLLGGASEVAGAVASAVQARPVADRNVIEYGSPQHEALLSRGYRGMTREKAETIIRERRENPALWPLARAEEAQAFLDALSARPAVISTVEPWSRGERIQLEG